MMASAGSSRRPFAPGRRALGLDEVLAAIERAESEWGESFAPPLMFAGSSSRAGSARRPARASSPTHSPTTGCEQGEAVKLETRENVAIAWLDRPPANSISPEVIQELGRICGAQSSRGPRSARS